MSNPLEFLEVARERQHAESRLLVRGARRRVAPIATGLDHRDLHAGFLHSVDSEVGQHHRDAAPLIVGIDCDHVELAELAFVKANGDEAHDCSALDGYPGLEIRTSARVANGFLLAHTPTVRIE